MIRIISETFGWTADALGEYLTIRTARAREIIAEIKKDKKYSVEIKLFRKKRSRDQNDMYWAILTQMAKALGISNNRAHNIMLCRYGQAETFDDFDAIALLPDTDETEEKVAEMEKVHFKPTSQVTLGRDGRMYRTYKIMRGSSKYDTEEMSRLIDGVLDECKHMGIPIIMEGYE